MPPSLSIHRVVGPRLAAGVLDGFLEMDPEQALYLVANPWRRLHLRRLLAQELEGNVSPPVHTPTSLGPMLGPGALARASIGEVARLALVRRLLRGSSWPRPVAGEAPPGLVREALGLLDALREAQLDHPGAVSRGVPSGALELLEAYRRGLDALGVEDTPERIRRWAIQLEEEPLRRGLGEWRGGLLVLDHPSELSPLERRLLRQLSQRAGRVQVVTTAPPGAAVPFEAEARLVSWLFEGAPSEVVEPGDEPHPLLRHLFRRDRPPAAVEDCFRLECKSPAGEIHRAAEWIRGLVESGAVSAPSAVALVLPDRDTYLPLVDEIFPEHGLEVHEELGRPLAGSRVVASLMALVEGASRGWPRRQLVDALRSPFLDWTLLGEQAPDPELLDQVGRIAGVLGGPASWLEALDRLAAQYQEGPVGAEEEEPAARAQRLDFAARVGRLRGGLEAFFRQVAPLEGAADARQYALALEALVGSLGVLRGILEGPDETWARREVRALRTFLELVDGLAEAEEGRGQALDPAGVEGLLQMVLPGTEYRDRLPTPAGVRVLTAAAARAGEWEALALVGFAEGAYPHPGVRVPMLGTSAGARALLAELPRFADPAREDLYRLLAANRGPFLVTRPLEREGIPLLPAHYWTVLEEAVTFSHPERPAGWRSAPRAFQEQLAAGLLREVTGQPDPEARASVALLASHARWRELARLVQVERSRRSPGGSERWVGCLEDPELLEHIARLFPVGGELAITALEEFAQCPFRFFAGRILGLEEREELAEDVDARARGELIHRILYEFLDAWRGEHGRVTEATRDQALASLRAVGERVFRAPGSTGFFWDREKQRLLGGGRTPALLEEWIDYEAAMTSRHRPALLEWPFGKSPTPPLVLEDGERPPVRVRGRIDRVDALEDGSGFVVWDYKTGSVNKPIPKLRAHIRLQLPLYMLAVARLQPGLGAPLGAAYQQVRKAGEVRTAGAFGRKDRAGKGGDYPLVAGARSDLTQDTWRLGGPRGPSLEDFLRVVERRVVRLVEQLRRGRYFAFRHPQDHHCVDYCPHRDVCRVEETEAARDFSAEVLPSDEERAQLEGRAEEPAPGQGRLPV